MINPLPVRRSTELPPPPEIRNKPVFTISTWSRAAAGLFAAGSLERVYCARATLIDVLADMEWAGIAINREWFASLKERFARERQRVEQEIYVSAKPA